MTEADGLRDPTQLALVASLSACVVCVGVWLSCLIARAVHNLGWKKVHE